MARGPKAHVHVHILPRSNSDFEDPDAVHKMIEAWEWQSGVHEANSRLAQR